MELVTTHQSTIPAAGITESRLLVAELPRVTTMATDERLQQDQDVNMTNYADSEDHLEEILLIAASPALVACIIVACVVIAAVIRSGLNPSSYLYQNNKLWKTRHIFQVFCVFCSVVGAFFGAYGIVPNLHKWWLMNEPAAAAAEHLSAEEAAAATAGSHHNNWYLYGFVFLRIIMMGGDTFCSMERCCALLFPLKFHTSWSCPAAIGVCTIWIVFSLFLTGFAVAMNIFANIEPTYLAIFDILGEDRFTLALTVLYLVVLVLVAASDTVALVYACRYRSKRAKSSSPDSQTTNTSSAISSSLKKSQVRSEEGGGGEGGGGHLTENLLHNDKRTENGDSGLITAFIKSDSLRPVDRCGSMEEGIKSGEAEEGGVSFGPSLAEVKLTARCICVTFIYLLSQCCIFIPALMSHIQGPAILRTDDVRLTVFFFYQLQFIKPMMYILIDGDLKMGVVRSLTGCTRVICPCCTKSSESSTHNNHSSFHTKSSSINSKHSTLGGARITKV